MGLAQWIYESTIGHQTRGTFHFGQRPQFGGGNGGLLFNKYVAYKAKRNESQGRITFTFGASSIEWAKGAAKTVGDASELSAYATRMDAFVNRMAGKCRAFDIPAWGHFATGVGIQHPIENGIAWHPTLGVPYLPGSSVKGMTLAWARDWLKMDDVQRKRIFGVEPDDNGSATMGSVIFLDAVPVEPPTLSAEVLNPHGSGSGVPEDAGQTAPIGFLAVKKATFWFSVLPSTTFTNLQKAPGDSDVQATQQAAEDVQTVLSCIGEALAKIGAGAKTKSGYGRFVASCAKC